MSVEMFAAATRRLLSQCLSNNRFILLLFTKLETVSPLISPVFVHFLRWIILVMLIFGLIEVSFACLLLGGCVLLLLDWYDDQRTNGKFQR